MTILPLIISVFSATVNGKFPTDPGVGYFTTVPGTVNKSLMLNLVNGVRKTGYQCGDKWYNPAPPVKWNEKLERAAYFHSLEMEEKKRFNHTSNDGRNPGTRITDVGFAWRAYGENIAVGYHSEKAVVDGWLSSPGHCRNIMNEIFVEMGVAQSGMYWTQVMATSLGR